MLNTSRGASLLGPSFATLIFVADSFSIRWTYSPCVRYATSSKRDEEDARLQSRRGQIVSFLSAKKRTVDV